MASRLVKSIGLFLELLTVTGNGKIDRDVGAITPARPDTPG